MHFKTVGTLLLASSGLAFAQTQSAPSGSSPSQEAGDLLDDLDLDISPEDFASKVPALATVPPSIQSAFVTAVPSSVAAAFADPEKAASLFSQWPSNSAPGWYSSLPTSVQAYASSVVDEATSAFPELASVLPTEISESEGGAADGSESKESPSASDNAAAAPTGMAAGVAGAAGMLAVVLAL